MASGYDVAALSDKSPPVQGLRVRTAAPCTTCRMYRGSAVPPGAGSVVQRVQAPRRHEAMLKCRLRLLRRQCLEVACRSANIRDGSGKTYDRTGLCRTSDSVKVKIVDT
jgi:hypothetical protein